MAGLDDARAKGESAVDAVLVGMAERAAELLRRDPGLKDTAVEVGLVDRARVGRCSPPRPSVMRWATFAARSSDGRVATASKAWITP